MNLLLEDTKRKRDHKVEKPTVKQSKPSINTHMRSSLRAACSKAVILAEAEEDTEPPERVRDTALLFERVRVSGSSAEEVRDSAWLSADVTRNNSGSEAEPAERTLDRVADSAESRPESRDEGLSESICERRLRRAEERESSGVVVKPVRRSSKIGSAEFGVQRREGEDSTPRSNRLWAGRKGGAPFIQLLK